MNFTKISQKAKELGKKSLQAGIKAKKNAVQFTEKSLRTSRFIINNADAFKKCIEDSREKTFIDKKTGVTKKFSKISLLFVCEENSEFTRSLLFKLPIVFTKSFSQNTQFGIILGSVEGVTLSDYSSSTLPFLILFENANAKKVVSGEENIQKVVNSLSLDINKTINEL